MAIKIRNTEGEIKLLPTIEEVSASIAIELLKYVQKSHVSTKADDNNLGHIFFNTTTPAADLGAVATPGATGKAADAGHVHKLPTYSQIGAAPASHTTQVASYTELGHIKITDNLSNTKSDTAPTVAAVATRINELEKFLQTQISELQAGVQFYASFYFGRTQPSTRLTSEENSPKSLAAKLGITSAGTQVNLFDFTQNAFCYYVADSGASTWGEPITILDEGTKSPNNGTQIGISGFFLDISQNTESLKLSGYANYSKVKNDWDIYPDKQSAIDNYTIVINEQGQRKVSDIAVTDTLSDSTVWEDDGLPRNIFEWTTAFYKKIAGLRADLSTEIIARSKANTLLENKLVNASSEIEFATADSADVDWE